MSPFRNYISRLRTLSAHRSYRRLLVGGVVSALGDRIGYIAFLSAVTSQSTDALAVGGITVAEMLPALFAAPIVSLIVDRHDKRRLMFISDIVRAVLFAIAAFVPESWIFYTTACISAAFTVLFEPSRQALEPYYLPEGELVQAGGMRMSLMSIVMICGPALGGLLVALFSFKVAFLVNAVSFLVSAWMVSDLEKAPEIKKQSEGSWKELREGFIAVKQNHVLTFLFILFSGFSLVIGIQFPLIYVLVKENLNGGPSEVGWLLSGVGIGGLIGGAALAALSKEKNPFNTMYVRGRKGIAALLVLDGVLVVLFAGMYSLWPMLGVFTFFGFIGTTLMTAFQAAVAEQSPEHVRGRVFALYSALNGPLIVLSIAIGTPFAREFGAAKVFYVSGGLELLIGIVGWFVAKAATPTNEDTLVFD